MEYHFKRQEISGERVLFALSLDKKSAKERILVGTDIEITKRLWNDPDAEVFYDETRPLGTLFMNYRRDETDIECVTAYGSFLPVFLYYHK